MLDASEQINNPSDVTVNSDGSFILGAFGSVTETIDALIGSGAVHGAGTAGADNLIIGASGGGATFSGSLQNGSASTTLSLTKSGAGTATLTGNSNTYSGGTAVNAGKLLVNNTSGSGTGTGTVNVNNSATLGGTGVISGAVNINNTAHLAPGTSPGILGTGSTRSRAEPATTSKSTARLSARSTISSMSREPPRSPAPI